MSINVLITGITGMDGRHLLDALPTYRPTAQIWGLVRSLDHPLIPELEAAGVRIVYGDLLDAGSIAQAIATSSPGTIYHLGAMASPSLAWRAPEACGNVTGLGTLRVLEAAHQILPPSAQVIVAGSLAKHGPYGAAKAYAQTVAADYRSRDANVITMVMGGHCSPLRDASYLAAKVVRHARGVRVGVTCERLKLGPLGRIQDWGWAPDFMDVWARAHELNPGEYVLSTGQPRSALEYVQTCYAAAGLHWEDWVAVDELGGNVHDVPAISAEPDPRLGLRITKPFQDLIHEMVNA